MIKEKHEPVIILMADDDEDDYLLTKDALKDSKLVNKLYRVEDGIELLDYLNCRGKYSNRDEYPLPGLILLDLNMPRKDGREALKEIKSDDRLRHIPVIIMTTSKSDSDVFKSYNLGSNSFITKPVSFEELVELMKQIDKYWFHLVRLPKDIEICNDNSN